MNIIKCYAYLNDSNEDDKDQHYSRLQSVIAKWSGKELTIMMGMDTA